MDDVPKTIKVRIYVQTDKIGSKVEADIEVDDDEWEGMEESGRNEFMMEYLWNLIEWGYDAVDADS